MSTTHLNRPPSHLSTSTRTETDPSQTPEDISLPVRSDDANASPLSNDIQRTSSSPPAIHAKALEAGIIDVENDPSNNSELEPEMVDWKGPDDPENPKKCVYQFSYSFSV